MDLQTLFTCSCCDHAFHFKYYLDKHCAMPNDEFIKKLDEIAHSQKDMITNNNDQMCNRFEYIYVHIPKNAGTSIRKKIKNMYDFVIIDAPQIKTLTCPRKIITVGHVPFSHYPEKKQLISFVRHPVSRCVSMFYYHKLHKKFPNINVFIDNIYNDKHIINFIQNKTTSTINSYFLKTMRDTDVSFSWKCQTYWISPDIYFIGKIENLENDLKKLCDKLECKYKLTSVNFNKNEYKPQQPIHISQQTKQKIYEIYKEDFDSFNYTI